MNTMGQDMTELIVRERIIGSEEMAKRILKALNQYDQGKTRSATKTAKQIIQKEVTTFALQCEAHFPPPNYEDVNKAVWASAFIALAIGMTMMFVGWVW